MNNIDLHDVFSSAPLGYLYIRGPADTEEWAENSIVIDLNRESEKIIGLEKQRILNRKVMEFYSRMTPDLIKFFKNLINRTVKDGVCNLEYFSKSLKKHFKVTAYIPAELSLMVIFTDITDQMKSDEKLIGSKERFELAMNAGEIGLWDWDMKKDTIFYSSGYYEMLGYTKEEFPFTKEIWSELMHPEDRKIVPQIVNEHLRLAQPYHVEFRMLCKDGSYKWISGRGKAFGFDHMQKPVRAMGLHIDITEQKNMQTEAEASREQLELVLNSANIGWWDWHIPSGREIYNAILPKSLGYNLGEIEPHIEWWENKIHPDDAEQVQSDLVAHFEGKTGHYSNEHRLKTKDGLWKWFADYGKVVERGQSGKPVRMIGTLIDISERKSAEAEKLKLQSQLVQAQKMESVGRLAGGVAHDFNNMLNVISGSADLILQDIDSDHPLFASVNDIKSAALRSAELTRQLLGFARKQTVVPRLLNLNSTVKSSLTMLRRLVREGIMIEWEPSEDIDNVNIDPVQIDQILTNIIVNSSDAIKEKGTISIKTCKKKLDREFCLSHPGAVEGQYVLLRILDNGSGIDETDMQHIFEPFFTTKGLGQGTGLGLAMVYGIVKQNKGFIDVVSTLGSGTRFDIYVPAVKGRAADIPEAEVFEDVLPEGSETVLLVEDETAVLDMTTEMLERLGYTVIASDNPEEAVKIAEKSARQIDLLLTDVIMPGLNGKELSEKLLSIQPGLKTLFMSGYSFSVIEGRGILDKDVHYLQKPFSMQKLSRILRDMFN